MTTFMDFKPFFNAIVREMYRHDSEKGDSWKTCDIEHLRKQALTLIENYQKLDNPDDGFVTDNIGDIFIDDELIDVGAAIGMYWMRRQQMITERQTAYWKKQETSDK